MMHQTAGGNILLLGDEAEQLFSQLNKEEKPVIIDWITSFLFERRLSFSFPEIIETSNGRIPL